jgi:DNA-binding transcriptional LysR family regulator
MNINTYPNPWDLIYFQEIAKTGNLSRAAERLGVGQPTLSLSMKRLEELLDSALFVRRRRGLELTHAGNKLLSACQDMMSKWDEIVSETKKSKTEITGRFKMGAHPSVAIFTLPDFIHSIYTAHPKLEIQLMHNLSRVVSEGVISGNIDFGIVVNPVPHPDLVIHKLAYDEVGFWKTAEAADDVLIYDPALMQSQTMIKKIGSKSQFNRALTSDNLEVITHLAKNHCGIAILPSRVVKTTAPELKRVATLPHFKDEISFIYRGDLPKSASTEFIINQIKKIKI